MTLTPSDALASSPPSVDVVVERSHGQLVVRVRGEVDIATHDDLSTRLSSLDLSGRPAVELHLDGLDFCDSHGVRQLLAFSDGAAARGCHVTLHDVPSHLARLIDLLGRSPAA